MSSSPLPPERAPQLQHEERQWAEEHDLDFSNSRDDVLRKAWYKEYGRRVQWEDDLNRRLEARDAVVDDTKERVDQIWGGLKLLSKLIAVLGILATLTSVVVGIVLFVLKR
jgi:hypothetical protein